jgi:hypothetical protein
MHLLAYTLCEKVTPVFAQIFSFAYNMGIRNAKYLDDKHEEFVLK